MDPYGFNNQFWMLQSPHMPGPSRGGKAPPPQATSSPPNGYLFPNGDYFPLLPSPTPSNIAYLSNLLPPTNPPSPQSSASPDSTCTSSPQISTPPPLAKSTLPASSSSSSAASASTSTATSSTASSSSSNRRSSSSTTTNPRKRRRTSAADAGEPEAEEDTELPPPLPADATEEERSVWLRQRNTIQARRNRKRRMLRFQQLEEDVEELSLSREMWKARACTLKEILAGHGLPFPDWS